MTDEEEALARAGRHLRQSILEAVEGLHALAEAATHASDATPAATLASDLLGRLEALLLAIRSERTKTASRDLADPILHALDDEIARWERRSHEDPDARAVLRTLLWMRETLWELGLRGAPAAPRPEPADQRAAGRAAPRARTRPRVQRFDVEH
ncbi:MAG: hypothetical protein H6748_10940 [Spirochaetaceae bacterium]|nr:hypothetical protein [Myxococcales bacterium]MCB9724550.1 hypothetical protein [Spirochaetaceae bacterium]